MANPADSRLRVIIDTDIGDDIDDAFALYLAVRSPELDVAGVTTVFKNTRARAQIAGRLLRLAGRDDIPVVPGASRPIVNDKVYGRPIPYEEKPPQYLAEMEGEPIDDTMTAAQFIVRTVKRSESKITLITLGALTNIATALMYEPAIADNIEKIVVMGGAYDVNLSEYNYSCDPEAAQIVLNAGIRTIAVGLDVTFRCELSETQVQALRASDDPVAQLIMRMREHWNSNHIYLHDPLAVAVSYRPEFVSLQQRRIGVEIRGEYTRGLVVNLSDFNWQRQAADSSVWVCTQVDSQSFTDFYINRVLQIHT